MIKFLKVVAETEYLGDGRNEDSESGKGTQVPTLLTAMVASVFQALCSTCGYTDCQKLLLKRGTIRVCIWMGKYAATRNLDSNSGPETPGSGVVPQLWMFIHSILTPWNQRFHARPFGNPFWQPV